MVDGSKGKKKGPYNGLLSRFIQRLENKINDKRLNFMFSQEEQLLKYDYMEELCQKLLSSASMVEESKLLIFQKYLQIFYH